MVEDAIKRPGESISAVSGTALRGAVFAMIVRTQNETFLRATGCTLEVAQTPRNNTNFWRTGGSLRSGSLVQTLRRRTSWNMFTTEPLFIIQYKGLPERAPAYLGRLALPRDALPPDLANPTSMSHPIPYYTEQHRL